ncbi:MAG: DUF4396 domain-containing protein [bacterium]|nr:DUF4396 domain-containing protein [bacterium]
MPCKKSLKTTAHVTLHCLTGCVIGEVIGLIIGVSLQWHPYSTMALATVLAFIVGILMAVASLRKAATTTFQKAFKAVWLGEVVSITVMEIAMNGTDYWLGGVSAPSVFSLIFWMGLIAALPVGYIAAFPINYWLISKHLKKCH